MLVPTMETLVSNYKKQLFFNYDWRTAYSTLEKHRERTWPEGNPTSKSLNAFNPTSITYKKSSCLEGTLW